MSVMTASSGSPGSGAAPDRRAIITEALRKIDDLTAKLAAAEKAETEPIAVVGIGARLPGGVDDADRFWQFLLDGGNGVIRVPAERWDADGNRCKPHALHCLRPARCPGWCADGGADGSRPGCRAGTRG